MENIDKVRLELRTVFKSGTVHSKAKAKELINSTYKRFGLQGSGKCTDLRLFGISYSEGKYLDQRTKKYINTVKID